MNPRILFAILLMGFTSLVAQTLAIREFLITFYGNELTIGLILANWILLGAIGSYVAGILVDRIKRAESTFALLQFGLVIYLPVGLYLIRTIKNSLSLTTGEGVGTLPILVTSFLILAPMAILIGAQFPLGSSIFSRATGKPVEAAGWVYVLEGVGFMLAGPIFTYLFLPALNSFGIFFIIGAMNLASALSLLWPKEKKIPRLFLRIALVLIFSAAALSIILFSRAINRISIERQWKGQDIVGYRNSIYGNLAVSKNGSQYTFYSNGIPVIASPSPDTVSVEERAHFTMLASAHPRKVLLIGGAGGIIREVLKYPVERVTYVELDPSLIRMLKDFPTKLTEEELGDKRLDIRYMDGRRFLHTTKNRYDVIILSLPAPSTLELNRFYTVEFFADIRERLEDGGVYSFTLPGSLSYISPELARLNCSVQGALDTVLGVSVIPGDSNLYIASKKAPDVNADLYLSRLESYGITTALINKQYFDHRLDPLVRGWFQKEMSRYKNVRKNMDLAPSGTFYSVWYWAALFSEGTGSLFASIDKVGLAMLFIPAAMAAALLALLGMKKGRCARLYSSSALATTGFAGMSLSLIMMYAYQSLYGYIFHQIAMLVMAFMAGLSLGSYLMNRRLGSIRDEWKALMMIESAALVFSVGLIAILLAFNRKPVQELAWIFFLLSGVAGSFIGAEFPLANRIYSYGASTAGSSGILYALDLAGSWVAALLTSIILVPVLGMVATCLFIAGVKALSLGLVIYGARD
jgi:spermidine synthase